MSTEVQANIQKFLYNLSTEDYAAANKNLQAVIDQKQQARFDQEYSKLEESVNTNPIDPSTPYVVIDTKTRDVIRKYTYDKRNAARRYAEKLNQEYGAHRYYAAFPPKTVSK